MAGPPSGRRLDAAYILSHITEQVGQVEKSWQGDVQIPAAARGWIETFASSVLSDLNERELPPGVDTEIVARQLAFLVPNFLEAVRTEAEASGSMGDFGLVSELPAELIEQRLPQFVAQSCPCWPQ